LPQPKERDFVEHKFDGQLEQKNWRKVCEALINVSSLDADEGLNTELNRSYQKQKTVGNISLPMNRDQLMWHMVHSF